MNNKEYSLTMKRLLILTLSAINLCCGFAQNNVKDLLKAMPDSIIPYLNNNQKAELSKFSNAHDSLKVKNMLSGETSIDSINSSFARIKLTRFTDIQVKLLPMNDSTAIICAIKTYRKPVPDSNIKFYTTDWKEIKDTFGLPVTSNVDVMLDLLTERPDTMSTTRYNKLRNELEPVIIETAFTGTEPTITYKLSLPLLNKEEKTELKSIIKQKSFKWNSRTFNKN